MDQVNFHPGRQARIAFVSASLCLGGSTTFLVNLGGELVRRRTLVQVFSLDDLHPMSADFAAAQIPVFCQDIRRRIFEDRLAAIRDALARFCPTTVVASLGAASFEILRYVPPGVFRVGAVQSDAPDIYDYVANFHFCLDSVAAVSRMIHDRLAARKELSNVPIHYLPYGVPMPAAGIRVRHEPGAPLRILYLGRLDHEQKRVRLFPQILKELSASGLPFSWTVAGTGPEEVFLRENLRTSRPDQSVVFRGHVPYTEIAGLLREHDVFLLASDYEGLPLSLLEAMGYGLVPVVSDLPSGIREVVDESTGFRVPPQDIPGFARAIIWLHGHRAELQRLSHRAGDRVRAQFSVSAMADRWQAILPQPAPTGIVWPDRVSMHPLLGSRYRFYFSPPFRTVRRLIKRLRR